MTREHGDCVIRYGGEEFILVLAETDLAGGEHLAERLRVAFAENPAHHTADNTISLTASFGVAAINFSETKRIITQYEMIEAADDLLYSAKNAGRNQVESGALH
jgi:diguanylate cyclase